MKVSQSMQIDLARFTYANLVWATCDLAWATNRSGSEIARKDVEQINSQ